MPNLHAVFDAIERVLLWLFSLLFAALIGDVMLQVATRNLGIAVLWTLDVAQLLFSWCIFLGAAVGVRRGMHYVIEIFPEGMLKTNLVLKLFSDVAITVVALVMLVHGVEFVDIGTSMTVESLGISQFWYFLPIPLCGALILLFMIDIAFTDLVRLAAVMRGVPR
ncbi:TRAP transporter small permease [Acuticoccus kandeliae]|uniref:TRAP transporter small permease n=1 Tax=Acuticoccus kandeliae TaxID=2073160 RepID=UPI000D3E3C08|nr:TRAP transporter small permease subunit [Acuticoccus kandeliae]